MPSIRACEFLDRFELGGFSGKVLPGAVCLGDLDGNGSVTSLAIANAGGSLAVFKGLGKTPW